MKKKIKLFLYSFFLIISELLDINNEVNCLSSQKKFKKKIKTILKIKYKYYINIFSIVKDKFKWRNISI